MSVRLDGKSLSLNVYDDMNFLEFLFGYLGNKDAWHTVFSECMDYYDIYDAHEEDLISIGFDSIFIIRNTSSTLRTKPFLNFIFFDLMGRLKILGSKYKNNSLRHFCIFKKGKNA